MLLQIPKSGFIRSDLEQNTQSLFEDLQSVPYNFAETMYRSEIVAFEEMWEWILDSYETLK